MIKIGGRTYKLLEWPCGMTEESASGNIGLIDSCKGVLYLLGSMCPGKQDETLLHEMGHLLYGSLNLDNDKIEQEHFCDMFSKHVDAFIKQNNLLPEGWSLRLRDDNAKRELANKKRDRQ